MSLWTPRRHGGSFLSVVLVGILANGNFDVATLAAANGQEQSKALTQIQAMPVGTRLTIALAIGGEVTGTLVAVEGDSMILKDIGQDRSGNTVPFLSRNIRRATVAKGVIPKQ